MGRAGIWAIALMLLFAPGCVGYRLGSMLPPDIRSVHVPTFVNGTGEPLIEADVTNATIEEFQRDGTLRILSVHNADTILNAKITEYRIDPLRYDRDERTRANEYRLTLAARIELSRRSTGAHIVEPLTVKAESWFTAPADLASAKKEALPKAARQLAHNIVERIVEAW